MSLNPNVQTAHVPRHERYPATPAEVSESVVRIVIDFLLALILFVLTLPFLLLAALLVKLTSRGPILYTQVRVGRGGRPYRVYKIRTMVVDSEKNGACWAKAKDPRVTFVGRFLRKTHLDELPQLWNVLLGDMSLLGPRPERPEFIPGLAALIPHYRERLRVRPGVSGLAQVQQGADTDVESVRKKLAYDLWYVDNQSVWLDFRIAMATGLKLFGVPFSTLRWLFRFPSLEVVEEAYQSRVAVTVPQPEVFRSTEIQIPASVLSSDPAYSQQLILNPSEQG